MNKRLDNAIDAARRILDDEAQDGLAAVVERFVSDQALAADALSPDEEAELQRLADGPGRVVAPEEHDRWVREKVARAIREADSDPRPGLTMEEIRRKLGLAS